MLQFSLLQEPLVAEDCTHVMVVLYKSRSKKAANEEGEGNPAQQVRSLHHLIHIVRMPCVAVLFEESFS